MPALAKEIAEATAFVLLIGQNGLGPWQVIEYYEAYDRRAKERDLPVILTSARPAATGTPSEAGSTVSAAGSRGRLAVESLLVTFWVQGEGPVEVVDALEPMRTIPSALAR
jgi:hypothetical protein